METRSSGRGVAALAVMAGKAWNVRCVCRHVRAINWHLRKDSTREGAFALWNGPRSTLGHADRITYRIASEGGVRRCWRRGLLLRRGWESGQLMEADGRMTEEGERCEPDIVALDSQCGEFESTLWCQHQDRAVERVRRIGAFWQRVVIFDIQNRLNGD